MSVDKSAPHRALSLFCRLGWMFLGPMALALAAVNVARGQGVFTPGDLFFFGVLAGILLARWLEFRAGEPQTATGEPATLQHLRRWATATSVVGVVIWSGAVLWRVL